MNMLIAGLALFLGVHSISIVAPAWRERMVARMGKGAWRAIYSVISIVGFLMIIWGYGAARQTPAVLYVPPSEMHYVSLALMLPVFPLLFAAYMPGRIKTATKHPMLLAIILWSLAHLFSNGTLADLLLFGGFLTWAVLDRISVVWSTLPGSRANDLVAVMGGLAVYAVFVLWLHQRWFGVPVV